MANAVIFGAGRVGRGFLAEVFQRAGSAITFVDKNINLVDELNRRGGYTIYKAAGALTDALRIREITALHIGQGGAIVDLLCTRGSYAAVAISPFTLREAADLLAVAIARRALEMPDDPLDILICDNNADPVARLKDLLSGLLGGAALTYLEEKVGLVRTIVMRLSAEHPPEDGDDPLALLNNGYPEMPVDAEAFKGAPPPSPMLHPTDNFTAESVRKIYTLNMAEAAMAYLGIPLGLTKSSQALAHPRVRPQLEMALGEAAHGLCGEYGFTERQMESWNAGVLTSLENPALDASLERLGVDAGRKVGRYERLVGSATLCQRFNKTPHALVRIIAYAYHYQSGDPGTRRMREAVQEEGIEYALERFSSIDFKNPLRALILDDYQRAEELLGDA